MAKKKQAGITEFEYLAVNGETLTVQASVKDGLIGYQVLMDGKTLSWNNQPPERFASEAEAQGAMLEYGSATDVRFRVAQIKTRLQRIEEIVSKLRGKEYCTQVEDLEQVVEMLSKIIDGM